MTFHSGSTDLNVVTLGAPHHQVREAPSAVSEVRGQAPAHTTEDGAPQAGHKILDTEHRDSQPSPGTETLKPPPSDCEMGQGLHVSFSTDVSRNTKCPSAACAGTPEPGAKMPPASSGDHFSLGQLPSFCPVGNIRGAAKEEGIWGKHSGL